MTPMDTAKATTMPTISREASVMVKWKPNFTSVRRLAPNMTGMARKKVNSAAITLLTPISSAPTIVAPEREVPGKIAAISWNRPIIRASF